MRGGSRRPRSSGGRPPTLPGGRASWPIRRPSIRPARVLAPETLDEMRWPLTGHRRVAVVGGLRARADPDRRRRRTAGAGSGSCTSATTAPCQASSPACTAGGAVPAPEGARSGGRWARRVRRRGCWSCHTRCWRPRWSTIRPTSAVDDRAAGAGRSTRRCSDAGGARATRTCSRGRRRVCGPEAPTTRRAGRPRSSSRSTARPTCCDRVRAGRPASACG